MDIHNHFKENLKSNLCQIGVWLATPSSYLAEMSASVGYDWVLIDAEHGPNTLSSILSQLQSIFGHSSSPIVRIPDDNPTLIKQVLDIGAQTILVPMVETAMQASRIVQATRYPPLGIRGVGSAIARASSWGAVTNYLESINDELCVIVQIESEKAVQNLDAILDVDGIDAIFIGPADLAASMGYLTNPMHPSVISTIHKIIEVANSKNIPVGSISVNDEFNKELIKRGINFLATAIDTVALRQALAKNIKKYR